MHKAAVISQDEKYRYSLMRIWDDDLPRVCFIMLNPSTADAEIEDPTTRRVLQFATDWGFGSYEIVNLFALRSSTPKILRSALDPIGKLNDLYIVDAGGNADLIVAAWGVGGVKLRNRDQYVLKMLHAYGYDVYCIQRTQTGHPSHPLYLPKESVPTPYA